MGNIENNMSFIYIYIYIYEVDKGYGGHREIGVFKS